jgi:hypothetical protein
MNFYFITPRIFMHQLDERTRTNRKPSGRKSVPIKRGSSRFAIQKISEEIAPGSGGLLLMGGERMLLQRFQAEITSLRFLLRARRA